MADPTKPSRPEFPPERDHADVLRERAAAALSVKRYDEALAAAAQAIAKDPAHYRGHGLFTQALLGKKRYPEAQRAAEAGLAVAPDQEWLHRLRSLALREQGLYKEALQAADEAVRLAPQQGYAHYTRAIALARMKRIDEARVANTKAVELDPNNAEIRRDLGDLYLAKQPKIAEGHYRASLSLEPNDAYALNNLGVALKRQRRSKEAVVAFKAAMLLDPTLGAAKRNTHATVKELARTGVPALSLVIFMLLVRIAIPDSRLGAAGIAISAVGLVVLVALLVWTRMKRKNDLSRLDPQLYEIFQKLDADKKAGRL